MRALQDAYWMAEEWNKEHYTSKKYRKSVEVGELFLYRIISAPTFKAVYAVRK